MGQRAKRKTVIIREGDLSAEIVPSLGAGLARFDMDVGRAGVPIFRPWPESGTDDPNQLACYLLAPWSNRISGGGFSFAGRFHALKANVPGDPLPLHGNAWLSDWRLVERDSSRAILELESAGPGPFSYVARVEYAIDPSALTIRLSVENRAAAALPFGLGLHPWLPRSAATRLQAKAKTVWLEDERHLPAGRVPVRHRPDWGFSVMRPLPDAWINNGFAGWDGRARIEWPERRLALEVEADAALATYLLYSPSRDAAFFCFEPVSHPVDAHNLPGGAARNGLAILDPGQTLAAFCRFAPRRL